MTLAYKNVFDVIAIAVPGFVATEDDRFEPSPYFFLSDMSDFLCREVALGSEAGLPEFAALLERMAVNGDADVRDLLIDALEGLRECTTSGVIANHFGQTTQELWKQVLQGG